MTLENEKKSKTLDTINLEKLAEHRKTRERIFQHSFALLANKDPANEKQRGRETKDIDREKQV